MRKPKCQNATHRLHQVKCVFYKKDYIKDWIIVNFVLPGGHLIVIARGTRPAPGFRLF